MAEQIFSFVYFPDAIGTDKDTIKMKSQSEIKILN